MEETVITGLRNGVGEVKNKKGAESRAFQI